MSEWHDIMDNGFVMPASKPGTDYSFLKDLLERASNEQINGYQTGELREETWVKGIALVYSTLASDTETWFYFIGEDLHSIRSWDK